MAILDWFRGLFSRAPKQAEEPTHKPLTAAEVEAAIDVAGRQDVFDRASELGWSPSSPPPPMWVWRMIAVEVMQAKGISYPTLH